MKGIFSKILLGIFSVLLVSATLFFDEKIRAKSEGEAIADIAITEGKESVKEKNGIFQIAAASSRVSLTLFGNSVLRIAPQSELEITFKKDAGSHRANIKLVKGRVWMNTLASDLAAEITTPRITVSAASGVFDVQYGEGVLLASAYRRSLKISFLENSLIVPETREISLADAKIEKSKKEIPKLQYSKLLKEFPFYAQKEPDAWVTMNRKEDAIFLENFQSKIQAQIREDGPKMGSRDDSFSFHLREWMNKTGLILTMAPDKKAAQTAAYVADFFDAGAYALLIGNTESAEKRFAVFINLASQMPASWKDSAVWKSVLEKRKGRFAFADPGNVFFSAKEALRKAAEVSASLEIAENFADVLDLAAAPPSEENEKKLFAFLRRFGSLVSAKAKDITDEAGSRGIFFDYLLLTDFLNRNPKFLKEEFLKIADVMEANRLAALSRREQADDERQFFMASKLRMIQAIKPLVESGDMPFQDGRRAVLHLINSIEAIKPSFSDAAVLTFYDDELAKIKPFIAFLRSSSAQYMRGSFQENYKAFTAEQEDLRRVTELLQTSEGGNGVTPARREELAATTAADLGGIGVSGLKVTLPDAEGDSRVKIVAAFLDSTPFTALYDTSRKVLSDISIDGKAASSSVRLENFKNFLLITVGKLVLPAGQSAESLVEEPQASLLEKVTKEKLLAEFAKIKVLVAEKDIGFEDLKTDVIHIKLAVFGEGTEAKLFSFDISQNVSVVSNLKVQTVLGEIPVNDKFAIRELAEKVAAVYERAEFDKEKEEALKGEEIEALEEVGEE